MKVETNIDTLKIQIDTDTPEDQSKVLYGIIDVISSLNSIFIKIQNKNLNSGRMYREHFIMFKGKKIAGITTGYCRAGSIRARDLRDVFFVALEYYGLTRHHHVDQISLICLLETCIYINRNDIPLRITAIDVCLDLIDAQYSQVLVLPIEQLKRIKYNKITGRPTYENTTYIEMQSNNMLSQAYVYPKHLKDKWIKCSIIRFECKFYPSFFRLHTHKPLKQMAKILNNYAVLYIEDQHKRESIVKRYNQQPRKGKVDLVDMRVLSYAQKIDLDYVEEFIDMLQNIDNGLFSYGDFTPSKHLKINQ